MEYKEDNGMILSLVLYPEKKASPIVEEELRLIDNFGIEGDHHADGGNRQISLLTREGQEWMQQNETKGFCFRKYRENLLLEGIPLEKCSQGDLLICGEVVLELTESAKSCHPELCKLASEHTECLLPDFCRFARVVKGGIIRKNMEVKIVPDNYK
ncbi:MAG: MOSC domain-containing protein [Lachnospiraceae bacterium]|nr:MOSC domain-containing protein [Lachnospiraceae bacterium]